MHRLQRGEHVPQLARGTYEFVTGLQCRECEKPYRINLTLENFDGLYRALNPC